MKGIIKFSVNHPVSVLMIFISFIICSCIAVGIIQIDFLPKMQDRFLLISTEYEGLPADQMKKLVTIPVEDSAASIKGIKNITSVTRDGISLIQIELYWNTDVDLALTESRQIIDQCYEILPNNCAKPNVRIFNPYTAETIKLVIYPKDGNLEFGRYIAKNDFKPRFQRIEGVASVNIYGGDTSEVQVIPDKTKIESLGLDLTTISQIINYSNFEYPAGNIVEGNKKYTFKTDGLIKNLDDLRNIPVNVNENEFFKLGDIATIKNGLKEKKSFFTYMGQECICVDLIKKTDANPITVSKKVRQLVSELNEMYEKEFQFIIIRDLSIQLTDSLKQLILSLLYGVFIATSILLIFFKKINISLLIASVMPLSVLSAILFLCLFNRSINVISISGIAIGIGMVIDPSIVLVENVIKNISANNLSDFRDEIYRSTEEVYLSSIGSTITTIIVFIPFFFLPGLTGKLFSDLAIAVISSIGFSCILSLSFIPAILVLILKNKTIKERKSLIIIKAEKKYVKILHGIFDQKKVIPFILVFILCFSIFIIKFLRIEIMPETYSPYMSVEILFDEKSTYDYLVENRKYLDNYIKKNQNFIWYTITGGIDDDSYEKFIRPDVRKECIFLTCKVKNVKKAKNFFNEILKEKNLSFKIECNKNILTQILDTDTSSFIICGSNEDELKTKLFKFDIKQYYPDSIVSEYVFEPDRSLCARYNISVSQTAQIAKEILDGVDAGYFYSDGKKIPIKVKYPKNIVTNPDQLTESMISISNSSMPISVLGHFENKTNEKIFYRYNRKDAKITNTIEIKEKNAKDLVNPNQEYIKELIVNALYLLIIVIILLYCVMGAQFESFSIPILMMLALPPAFTGAFLFLFIFNQSININSIIALVILFGTAVNNSIILYEAVRSLKKINEEQIILQCSKKLRSILITTLTSICALIPFAIDPLHKNAQSSLSTAIIGGLIFSFIIVLLVIPVIFSKVMIKKGMNDA